MVRTDEVVLWRLRIAGGEHCGLYDQFTILGKGDISTHATRTTPYPIRINVIQIIKKSSPVGKRIETILRVSILTSTPSLTKVAAIISDICRICL